MEETSRSRRMVIKPEWARRRHRPSGEPEPLPRRPLAGTDVVVYLLNSCSPIGELIGSESGMDRYVSLDEKSRVEEQVFEGRCIRIESPVGEDPGRMADAIASITRDTLREWSGWEL